MQAKLRIAGTASAALLAAFLAACSLTGAPTGGDSAADAERALGLARQGDHAASARAYEAAARNAAPDALNALWLKAAGEWVLAAQADAAEQAASKLVQPLSPADA